MESTITIRRSTPQDFPAIEHLAGLDSRRTPRGEAFLAYSGTELRAAMPIDDPGGPIADPFHPTAEIVDLLRIRAQHSTRTRRTPRRLKSLRLRAA